MINTEPQIFAGFEDIWHNFLGFDEDDIGEVTDFTKTTLITHLGEFWDKPVIVVDDVDSPWLLDGHSGKDLTVNTAHGFHCLDIAVEGMVSRLFFASDLDAIIAASNGEVHYDYFLSALIEE